MKRSRAISSRSILFVAGVAASAAKGLGPGRPGEVSSSSSSSSSSPRRDRRPLVRDRPSRELAASPAAGWYPNWSKTVVSGNVCLSDAVHPRPSYMTEMNLLKETVKECCDAYYWWDMDVCLAGASAPKGPPAPAPAPGWYADYSLSKCVRNCPTADGGNCGGTVKPAGKDKVVVHTTAAACCQSQFAYQVSGWCEATSTGTSYKATEKYYVDYGKGRCSQDCAVGNKPSKGDGICGGIVKESSTKTYDTPAACCSTQLSYIDPLLCQTRSRQGGAQEGTFRLYPDQISGTCVIDQDPSNAIVCGIGYACRLIPATSWVSELYAVSPSGVEECCAEGLSYVNPSYCKSRTMGIVSRKWFVNYAEKRCRQDCEVGSGPSCAVNKDSATAFYDSPEQCCSSKLGYRNQAKCKADSTGTPYAGSNMYYVNFSKSRCDKDCPEDKGGDCGGIVEDSGTVLYKTVSACCAAGLAYMDPELCADKSDSTAKGTGKFYPSVEDSICVKDTSLNPCPTGMRCKRADGWVSTLYDATSQCCESIAPKPKPKVNVEYCKALSTGVATGKWFQHESNRCAKHCAVAGSCVECAVPTNPAEAFHTTAEACCKAELSYLKLETCLELSEKGGKLTDMTGTNEFYVDWIHQKCVKNCPVGKEASCGGIAGGKWMELYPSKADCCKALHYIDSAECAKA